MTLREQLLRLSEDYATARRLSRARVSTLVFNGGHVIGRIAAGGDVTTGRFEQSLQWFSDHWPDAVAWPEGIIRPAKARAA